MSSDQDSSAVIFDIDGTLLHSFDLDTGCFIQALKEILQIQNISTDWQSYRFSTDEGLMQEIAKKKWDAIC